MRQYSVLPRRPLQPQTSFHVPWQDLPPRVTLDDAAVSVMTDFRKVTAFTIDPDVSVDTAARVMRRRKVHLLLVVDVENIVVGIITSNDLIGEKTLQCISARGISPRRRAGARHHDAGRPARGDQHGRRAARPCRPCRGDAQGHRAAPCRRGGRGRRRHQVLRGLLSCSQIALQLGEPVEPRRFRRTSPRSAPRCTTDPGIGWACPAHGLSHKGIPSPAPAGDIPHKGIPSPAPAGDIMRHAPFRCGLRRRHLVVAAAGGLPCRGMAGLAGLAARRRALLLSLVRIAKVGAGATAICGARAAGCRRRRPRLRLGGGLSRSCAWPTNCRRRWKAATSN
jgi:hypothetical protein